MKINKVFVVCGAVMLLLLSSCRMPEEVLSPLITEPAPVTSADGGPKDPPKDVPKDRDHWRPGGTAR